MFVFEDIQDIEDWLEPLDLDDFWEAVTPWNVFSDDERAHHDQVLTKGEVDPVTVLACLKGMARIELTARLGLKDRIYMPPDAQYVGRVH